MCMKLNRCTLYHISYIVYRSINKIVNKCVEIRQIIIHLFSSSDMTHDRKDKTNIRTTTAVSTIIIQRVNRGNYLRLDKVKSRKTKRKTVF